MDPCDVDDLTTYHANGTYTLDEGPTLCNPGDPQTYTGVWSLNSSQTVITVDGFDANLKNVTETTHTIEFTEEDGGVTYTYQMNYTKQ